MIIRTPAALFYLHFQFTLRGVKMLQINDLKKHFGGIKAVDGVSLETETNKITLLIGPNGSGKTTTINLITGYYEPDGGEILFGNQDITGWPMHEVYETGLVRSFQFPSPFQGLTVLGNLLVASRSGPGESYINCLRRRSWSNQEEKDVEKAFSVIDALDLNDLWDEDINSLSTGHLKLLEIGRALMADARMVILDEPICGVNPTLADEIFSYIVKLKEELDLTFLVIEHRLDVALKYADFVFVLNHGRLISKGEVDKVINDPQVREVYMGE